MKINRIVCQEIKIDSKIINPSFGAKPVSSKSIRKITKKPFAVANTAIAALGMATIAINDSEKDKKIKENNTQIFLNEKIYDPIRSEVVEKTNDKNQEIVNMLLEKFTWLRIPERPPVSDILNCINEVNEENINFIIKTVNEGFYDYKKLKALILHSKPDVIPSIDYVIKNLPKGEYYNLPSILELTVFAVRKNKNVDLDKLISTTSALSPKDVKYAKSLLYYIPNFNNDYEFYLNNFHHKSKVDNKKFQLPSLISKEIPLNIFAEFEELKNINLKHNICIPISNYITPERGILDARLQMFKAFVKKNKTNPNFKESYFDKEFLSEAEKFLVSENIAPLNSANFIINVRPENLDYMKFLCQKEPYFTQSQIKALLNIEEICGGSKQEECSEILNFCKKLSKDPFVDNVMLKHFASCFRMDSTYFPSQEVSKIYTELFEYYKKIENNKENYVANNGYQPYEIFIYNIPTIARLFKYYDKQTIEALFQKRLNIVKDYLREIDSFCAPPKEWLLLKNLMSAREINGRKLTEEEQLNILRIIKSYKISQLDLTKLYKMAESKTINLKDVYTDLYQQIFKNVNLTDAEINNMAEDELYSWNIEYMPYLFKSMEYNKDAFKDILKASILEDFNKYIHNKKNIYGKSNYETQKIFKENNMNYKKWLKPSKKTKVKFFTVDKNKEQLKQISQNLLEDIETLRKSPLKNFFDKRYSSNIKNDIFNIPTDIVSSKSKLLTFIKNLLTQLTPAWKRAEQNINAQNTTKSVIASQTLTIKDHLEQRLKDIEQVQENTNEQIFDLTIKMWDRLPQKDLFQGNYSTCCIKMGGQNGHIMPHYILNTAFNMIELIDNNTQKTIGNALCYFLKNNNNQIALVIDNIEINNSYIPSEEIGKKLLDSILKYASNVCKEVMPEDIIPIYIGKSYNDIKIDGKTNSVSGSFLGEIDTNRIYLDAFGGWLYTSEIKNLNPVMFSMN